MRAAASKAKLSASRNIEMKHILTNFRVKKKCGRIRSR
jgi:hypothetical protein